MTIKMLARRLFAGVIQIAFMPGAPVENPVLVGFFGLFIALLTFAHLTQIDEITHHTLLWNVIKPTGDLSGHIIQNKRVLRFPEAPAIAVLKIRMSNRT